MILFKKYHVKPILCGLKICTRRSGLKRWNKGSIHEAKINYNSDSCFASLKIIGEPYREKLSLITSVSANHEGGYTIHECKDKFMNKKMVKDICSKCHNHDTCFQIVWVEINGEWNPEDVAWVVYFKCLTKANDVLPMANTVAL